MARYGRALRFVLGRQASAYGFTLTIWGTGALASAQLGAPRPAEVFAFIGGALVATGLAIAAVFGVARTLTEEEAERRAYAGIHLPSVLLALLAGWGTASAVDGSAGFFAASLAAVTVYQGVVALQVALALHPPLYARKSR